MEATRIAGSLEKPESASAGVSSPLAASAMMMKTPVRSSRTHSVTSSTSAAARMIRKMIWAWSMEESVDGRVMVVARRAVQKTARLQLLLLEYHSR